MKKSIYVLAALLGSTSAIWPLPKKMENKGTTKLYLDPCDFYGLNNYTQFDLKLEQYAHIFFKNAQCKEKKQVLNKIIRWEVKDASFSAQNHDTDESYTLSIDSGIDIKSENYVGYVRALETVSQLIKGDAENGFYIENVPLEIEDSPDYNHRGLMIDTARHFLPKSVILRTLDAMQYNKMNVMHWHITDDESFPLQLETFP